jgi:hypothetical protein
MTFKSFSSEVWKLYTEDSQTDDRGWWPRRRKCLGFKRVYSYKGTYSLIAISMTINILNRLA